MSRLVVVVIAVGSLLGGTARAQDWAPASPERRPVALPVLYVSFAALQGLDAHTTARALGAGARERNPLIAGVGGSIGATLAVKAAAATATVVAVERLWKTHRTRAIVVMAVANGVTAAVAMHNLRVGRAQVAR
jgi:hypothetical protein